MPRRKKVTEEQQTTSNASTNIVNEDKPVKAKPKRASKPSDAKKKKKTEEKPKEISAEQEQVKDTTTTPAPSAEEKKETETKKELEQEKDSTSDLTKESKKEEVQEKSDENVQIIEKGLISFFYRPKVGFDVAEKMNDVQRLIIVLSVKEPTEKFRLLIIPRKSLPHSHTRDMRLAILDIVSSGPHKVDEMLEKHSYVTKGGVEKEEDQGRALAEGIYTIVSHSHKDKPAHIHLVYKIGAPNNFGEGTVQNEFNIQKEGNLLLSAKSPEFQKHQAETPHEEFPQGLRKWSNEPFTLLDKESTHLLLINVNKTISEDLGKKVEHEMESIGKELGLDDLSLQQLYDDLHLDSESLKDIHKQPILTQHFS